MLCDSVRIHCDESYRSNKRTGEIWSSNRLLYLEKGKNWMHVRYTNPQEAVHAMMLNGCLIERIGLIIGVIKCEDPEFCFRTRTLQAAKEERKHNIKTVPIPRRTRGWITKFIEYIFNW